MKYLSFIFICMTAAQPALAQSGGTVAGTVVFSSGSNTAISMAGERRAIRQGDAVRSGDKLQTDGHLQIRFTDKGFVSLKPKSQLAIAEYAFGGKEDGTEKAFFSLLKGSMRAVTGLIGKRNKNSYKVDTPVATIGIRGTAFVLHLCNNDCFAADGSLLPNGLYANNGEGRIYIKNSEGTLDLVRGQFAFVADIESEPRQITQPPALGEMFSDKAENYDFGIRVAETTIEEIRENPPTDPNPVDPDPDPPVLGTLQSLAFATFVTGDGVFGTSSAFSLADDAANRIQKDGEGAVTGFSFSSDGTISFNNGAATLINSGVDFDKGLSWGVWDTGYTLDSFGQSSYLHYIAASNMTPVSAMPGSGHIRYSGSTSAGNVLGTLGQMPDGEFVTDFSILLDIDFANGELSDLRMSGAFANGDAYTAGLLSSTPLTLDRYALTGSFTGGGQTALLNGHTQFSFFGDAAEGLMGSYDLNGSGFAVIGTYAVEQTGSFNPSIGQIEGLTATHVGGTLVLPIIDITSISTGSNDAVTGFDSIDPQTLNVFSFDSGSAQLIAERSGRDRVIDATWGIWEGDYSYTPESEPQYMAYMGFANPTDAGDLPGTGSASFNVQLGSNANGALNLITNELSDSFSANIGVDWSLGHFTRFDLAATFPDSSSFAMEMFGSIVSVSADSVSLDGTYFDDLGNQQSAFGTATPRFANEGKVVGGTFSIGIDGSSAAIGTFLLGSNGLPPRLIQEPAQ